MDLLKFLRKKKIENFEELLKKAADEPAYRVEFSKRILDDKLVIITKSSKMPEGIYKLEKDTNIKIFTFDNGVIPVFTSTDRIFDKGVIKEQVTFLEMKGRDLFETVKGATLLLNPYSDYGKEFLPEEIESLLDGTFLTRKVKHMLFAKDTNVRIGQPAEYPTEIIKSLIHLFSKKACVNTAYVAWIQNSTTNEPPHYIFAIDTEEDWNSLINEAGYIAQQILGPGQIVDFIKIGDGGINDYFKNTGPF